MNKVSITIMAHPERKKMAESLSKEVDAPVIYDRKNNLWDTCRRAWIAHNLYNAEKYTDSEYSLVLQDDAIVCKDFRQELEKLVTNGEYIYSLYSGNMVSKRLENANKHGKDHILAQHIYNEIALCIPTKYILEMVDFCDKMDIDNDHGITKWAWRKGLKIYYPYQSLVDHRDAESIYHPGFKSKAFNFKGK